MTQLQQRQLKGSVASTRPARRGGHAARRANFWGWAYVIPFMVVFVLFLVVPLIYAFWLSIHTTGLASGTRFSGIENYVKAFTDPIFLAGLRRVALFAIVMIPIQIAVALLAALVLDSLTSWFSKAARLMIFIPYAIPVVIGALMWGFLYSPRFGPAATVFDLFGATAPDFLSPGNIFSSLVNVVTWQWAGYYMIIIYSSFVG